jgi:predicted phosphodiesterase
MAHRVAALYDIHGNLPALEVVLDEVRRAGVDQVVVGGDVLPGPMMRETLALLRQLDVPTRFIQGNCEVAVLSQLPGGGAEPAWYRAVPESAKATLRWQAQQVDAALQQLFAGWPPTCRVDVDGIGEVLFCHATPRHENEVFTRLTPEERLLPVFDAPGVPLVVCGHTHMQFDRMIGRTRVVNAGSIGMPFGEPGADWLLLGPGVDLRHTTYDLTAAADRIRATSYPDDYAGLYVLKTPAAAEMLELFTTLSLSESAGRG